MLMARSARRGHGGGGGFSLAITAGDAQTGTVAAALSTSLQVRATSPNGTGIPGVPVLFTPSGDGSVNSASTVTVYTNSTGYASVIWRLQQTVGANSCVISAGAAAPVTATATGTVSAAATIEPASVLDQGGSVNTAVTTPPAVLVKDAQGNPVSGQAVVWAVASGGGAVVGGGTTNANGIATLTSYTLGPSVGANSCTATVAGLTGSPVTFTASAVASAATQLAVQSGGAQTGVGAGVASAPITFRAKDVSNAAVQGVFLTITATGGGTPSAANGTTNASGDVAITVTDTVVRQTTVTAQFAKVDGTIISVSTTVTTTFAALAGLVLEVEPDPNCASGTALSQQPVVRLVDQYLNVRTSDTTTVTATLTAGDGSISAGATKAAVAGRAIFTALTIVDANGGTDSLQFSAGGFSVNAAAATSVAPPVATKILMVTQPSGGFAGGSLVTYSVRVTDASNVTIPGYSGQITVTKQTGTGVLSGTVTVACVNGVATFPATVYSVAEPGVVLHFADPAGLLTTVNSAAFTVTTQGASNEPVGYTPLLGASGKVLVSGATQLTQTSIQFKDATTYVPPLTPNGVQLAAPGLPPSGDTHLAVVRMNKGDGSGNGFGTIYCTPNLSSLAPKRLYMSAYVRLSENWYGESTGTLKFFQPLTNTTSVTNRIILSLHGAGNNALAAKLGFQFGTYTGGVINGVAKSGSTTYYSPAGGTGVIVRGQWHFVELVVIANTAGNADGTIQAWVDGAQTHSFVGNNRWDGTGFSWLNAQIQTVYGGPTVLNVIPDDQYVTVASPYYVSTHA